MESFIKDEKINKILITSITRSSGNIIEKKFNQNSKVVHQFLPFDVPMFVNKFLNKWKPNLAIFIDSEIWPNLILKTSDKKIPLLLVNARITKKSFNRWKIVINFAKKVFKKFDLCLVSNRESEDFLKFLGAKNIKNHGNLKFSNIKNNFNKSTDLTLFEKIKDRKVWCAASTHQNEEILCASAHQRIKKYYKNVLTIIIPRHINRINKIKNELISLDLNVVLSSQLDKVNASTDILLIDSYGEALKFYNISKYVFVGKSLLKSLIMDGGQNPIEPARLGCQILHGPYVGNFLEIYSYLKKLGVSKEINSSDELGISLVENFKNNMQENSVISEEIEKYGQNILNNTIKELKKYI
jgi:3-deoxy-D-manno-octulosonic-acid transferase